MTEFLKFNAPVGQDTMMKGGVSAIVNTKHVCISAMKEYENKSMEVRKYPPLDRQY